jgi:putative DNA primase/helicase
VTLPGHPLADADFAKLAACGISRELAEQALLRRVDSQEGAAIVGRNGAADCSGILFPYVWPAVKHVRDYRLRRDRPEIEFKEDGRRKERNKYLSPPGRGNMLYFVPGTPAEWLENSGLPVVLTEGEKKTLALWALAHHGLGNAAELPRFLPVGLPGVWNWRGTVGKTTGPDGDRRNVTGPIVDLDRVAWKGRRVTIIFDTNVYSDDSVGAARHELAKELAHRGAKVHYVDLPTVDGINGIDDLVGTWGPERVLELFKRARSWKAKRTKPRIIRGTDLMARQAVQQEHVTDQQAMAIAQNLLDEHLSDYGNSRRLILMYGEDLRYCPAFNKWLVYDGRRWAVDDGEVCARQLSQATMLEFARQAFAANDEEAAKFAARCLNSARISNALREAQPALVVTTAKLDTHPDLLNCQNGTLDLKTGCLRPHRREDFITKLVHHDYDPHAECPAFLGFLARITANHPGLIGYLQRAFGYTLTGHTIEKAVFLLHGRGDNGKSTLLTTFLALLKEYAVLLQIDTLMVRQESNNTQADLADLRGARFVVTSETEEGQRLAEGKLKRITQGMGRIKATRKYENPIEFPETHKLWIDANHLPGVRGVDNAIWNRLHAVPFDVTIPKLEQDKELPAKLAMEADGILSWAVAGAAQWYRDRLAKPTDVEEAGQAWRSDSDQIGRFTQEKCVPCPNRQVPAEKLYLAYKEWTQETGEHPITSKIFGERIVEKYQRKKLATGNVYLGIGLAESE